MASSICLHHARKLLLDLEPKEASMTSEKAMAACVIDAGQWPTHADRYTCTDAISWLVS
jgi:hypothetical protein